MIIFRLDEPLKSHLIYHANDEIIIARSGPIGQITSTHRVDHEYGRQAANGKIVLEICSKMCIFSHFFQILHMKKNVPETLLSCQGR